ncbi:SDR family NAD(P)-dependent oxidoreductase [Myxococcus stipitatus]|uniref:SDR family NAD(P)-dependent oxidoreductase n=1 Tax=Myxococcus stipitatus TaxID=83455 RepID=UPI0030D33E8D
MTDLILTGASRGIGAALARALAKSREYRLILVARDRPRLEALASAIQKDGGEAIVVTGDLSTLSGARALGQRLVEQVTPGATLVHNAGIWPSRRELTVDGFETGFAVNHAAPLLMQQALLEAKRLRRILLVSAGLLVKGRFDAARTPIGEDFSSLRTYCDTKLGFALEMRDVAATHPELDVLVLHPGVVRTDLGARTGPIGWVLSLVKRGWETPEVCAERLSRILAKERWSPPGQAHWYVEEAEQPWPPVTEDAATRRAVREVHERLRAMG